MGNNIDIVNSSDEFHDYGIEYYDYSRKKKKYEGTFRNNKYVNKGILYYYNGIKKYEGFFMEGEYHGYGKLYETDGKIIYSGNFIKGLSNGTGIYYKNEYKYEGNFINNAANGHCIVYKNNKAVFEGNFTKNIRDGHGIEYYDNGKIFLKGYWNNGILDLNATIYYPNGNIAYEGGISYHDKKINYQMKMGQYLLNCCTIELLQKDLAGYFNGSGKIYNQNGTISYIGNFCNNKKQGNGKLFDSNGKLLYDGQFIDNKYSGCGKLYKDGHVYLDGIFMNGEFINGKEYVYTESYTKCIKCFNSFYELYAFMGCKHTNFCETCYSKYLKCPLCQIE